MEDESVTTVYNTTGMGKRMRKDKQARYYLEPCELQTEADDVNVPRSLYDRVAEGQLMQVYFKKDGWVFLGFL